MIIGAATVAWLGIYDVGADSPHTKPVLALLRSVREQSIASRARHIEAPTLGDPKLLAEGAEHYSAMCADCHLAPGTAESELRQGSPETRGAHQHSDRSPAEQFWIIKHGIKFTAMPAWGKTHSDNAIWGLVAFLQRLPTLTPEQYTQMTAPADAPHHADEKHPNPMTNPLKHSSARSSSRHQAGVRHRDPSNEFQSYEHSPAPWRVRDRDVKRRRAEMPSRQRATSWKMTPLTEYAGVLDCRRFAMARCNDEMLLAA